MPNRFRLGFRRETITALNSSLGGSRRYFDKVMDVAPANLIGYWPMNESGGSSIDYSGQANNGDYRGVTFGAAGIGDGFTGTQFGVGARNNIFSAALTSDFNGNTGSFHIWGMVNDITVWSDGAIRYAMEMNSGSGNRVFISKGTATSTLAFGKRGSGGAFRQVVINNFALTDFVGFGITWSNSASRIMAYINGATSGTLATPDQYNNALIESNIGAQTIATANPWNGILAHGALYNIELPPESMTYIGIRS